MITKEQAIETAKKYLKDNNWDYIFLNTEKVELEEKREIHIGKYEDKKRDVFTVGFRTEGYQDPISYFIYIDANTEEVLFILGPHGSLEILK